MFTPQRKSPWTPPPSSALSVSARLSAAAKGKSVAFVDGPPPPPPPPQSSIEGDIVMREEGSEDWKRFKEAGLLDDSSIERKDRRALQDKIAKIEKELYDYQYNMGLLLIEKNDLVSKNEELVQEVVEAQEILKREQSAHLIAISEADKREENLKRALDVERKCLVDLERSLRDMHEEHSKFKATSETTVTDVNTRMEALEKQRLDIEAKSHLAVAKIAEADRKNSELDQKLQDLEVRESILQREHLTLTKEKEAHQSYFRKQKEDLLDWEKKLQEEEQRLCDRRRILKEQEDKLLQSDRTSKEKEAAIDELQQKIDLAEATLKNMEDITKNKLADLDLKEKKAEAMRCNLEMREQQLREKEERLKARETTELEKQLNEQKKLLDAKMQALELELQQKRKSHEEELKSRAEDVKKKEAEVNHLVVKLGKREEALEKKSERVKEKKIDVESKVKALQGLDKSLKGEEKRLEVEKKHINAEKEVLEDLRKELEMWKINLRKQDIEMEEERKKIEVLQEEKSEYLRLQSNLKLELENARRQGELIEKEANDLKMEREKFEKDWEALDEKRAVMSNEIKMLDEEKARFEKLRNSEQERLKRELAEEKENLRLESENFRLEKESFEALVEHQKSMLAEKEKNEYNSLLKDLEEQKQDFYSDVQKRQRVWEKSMEEKEKAFEEMKSSELENICRLKEVAERKKEEMEIERRRLKKEREDMELNKEELEKTRIAMSEDVAALDDLSKRQKKQREEFVSERNLFSAFVEKIKSCRNCGDSAQLFQMTNLEESIHFPGPWHDLTDSRDGLFPSKELSKGIFSPPAEANGDLPRLGGQMSVLRKCASVIFKSPKDRVQSIDNLNADEYPNSAVHLCANESGVIPEENLNTQTSAFNGCEPSREITNDSFKDSPPDVIVREDTVNTDASAGVLNVHSAVQSIQESEKSDSKTSRSKPGRKRGTGVRRTNSVKAVVEDAKAILGEDLPGTMEKQPDNSAGDNDSKQQEGRASRRRPIGARKRSRSQSSRATEYEQDPDYSDENADSVATGGRRKKGQTVAGAMPTAGQRRYNLRRHTGAETATTKQASNDKHKNEDKVTKKGTSRAVQDTDDTSAQVKAQVLTTRSIEITSDRVVRFRTTVDLPETHINAIKSSGNTVSSGEAKSADNTLRGEEVNRTSENIDLDDNRSMVNENEDDQGDDGSHGGDPDEDEDEDEDDNDDHPGQASIGKKLWKFFTS